MTPSCDEYIPYDIETEVILNDRGTYEHHYFLRTKHGNILFHAKSDGFVSGVSSMLETYGNDLADEHTHEYAKQTIQDRFKHTGLDILGTVRYTP